MNNNPPSDDVQYKISQEFIKVKEREKDGKRLHAKIQSTAQLMGAESSPKLVVAYAILNSALPSKA